MTVNLLAVTLLALTPTILLWTWWHAPAPTMSECIRKVLCEPDGRIHS
jgi:hypothetical protein